MKVRLHVDERMADLLPRMTETQLKFLHLDIARRGCLTPIVIWKQTGMVLDGMHRLAICMAHKIRFDVVELHFDTRAEAEAWAIQNALARRQLPMLQRIELALRLESIYQAAAKDKQRNGGRPVGADYQVAALRTNEAVGELAGVSHDTVAKAKVILASGLDEVIQQVREDDLSIRAGYELVLKHQGRGEERERRKQQRQLVAARRKSNSNGKLARAEDQDHCAPPPPTREQAINALNSEAVADCDDLLAFCHARQARWTSPQDCRKVLETLEQLKQEIQRREAELLAALPSEQMARESGQGNKEADEGQDEVEVVSDVINEVQAPTEEVGRMSLDSASRPAATQAEIAVSDTTPTGSDIPERFASALAKRRGGADGQGASGSERQADGQGVSDASPRPSPGVAAVSVPARDSGGRHLESTSVSQPVSPTGDVSDTGALPAR